MVLRAVFFADYMDKLLSAYEAMDPRYMVGFGAGLLVSNLILSIAYLWTGAFSAAAAGLIGIGGSLYGMRSAMLRVRAR